MSEKTLRADHSYVHAISGVGWSVAEAVDRGEKAINADHTWGSENINGEGGMGFVIRVPRWFPFQS